MARAIADAGIRGLKPVSKVSKSSAVIIHPSAYCGLYRKCPHSYRLRLEGAASLRDLRPSFEAGLCQSIVDRWFLEDGLRDPLFPQKVLPEAFDNLIDDPDLELLPGETRESLFNDCVGLLDHYGVMLREEGLFAKDGVRVKVCYGTDDSPIGLTRHAALAGTVDYVKAGPSGDELFMGQCSRQGGAGDPLQLYLAALGLERRFGRPISAVHFLYYRQRTKVSYGLDAETRKRVLQELEESCRLIHDGTLPAAPCYSSCSTCRFRLECRHSVTAGLPTVEKASPIYERPDS